MNINFLASLNNKQLTALTELFNGQHVFQPEVDTNTVAALFMCRLKEPLVVCNARTLCYIFHILSEERLITPIWQAVAAKNKCFASLNGKPISRNTLSSAKVLRNQFRLSLQSLPYQKLHRHPKNTK